MFDPVLSLAFSLHSNKGAYALLLGSGVSRSAGIPTGWQVVENLVRKIAAASGEGAQAEPDPVAWYRTRYRKEPNYTRLLDDLARTPAERAGLLRGYFEPTEEERERKEKLPTAAHHAIAALVASGHVRVIVTTNFDRLLEQALDDVGVAPIVAASPDAAEGALPLVHTRCFVLKVHGDYLDPRIKNTDQELAKYHPHINRLLDQVFDEFGLVVAGWSADYDVALRAALERCKSHRFTTYWTTRKPLSGIARTLATQRRAQELKIRDADSFFVDLREKLDALDRLDRAHPVSVDIAVERLKRYIDDEREIDLHDLVIAEVEHLYRHLGSDEFPVHAQPANKPTKEGFLVRLQRYEALSDTLVSLFANGVYWGSRKYPAVWLKALERVWNSQEDRDGWNDWLALRQYPALLLLYASGLAVVAVGDYGGLRRLLMEPQFHGSRDENSAGEALSPVDVIEIGRAQQWVAANVQTPVSDRLFKLLRPKFSSLLPDETSYTKTFGRWEYLYALHRASLGRRIPRGQYGWREQRGESVITPIREEAARMGAEWPPLKAGLFGGTVEAFSQAETLVSARVGVDYW